VGADRLVNAFATGRLYGTPAVVVDLGTATTFDCVASDGGFVGGAIAPGAALGLEALANRTALLPHVELEDAGVGGRHIRGVCLGARAVAVPGPGDALTDSQRAERQRQRDQAAFP
jgi:type III pantothenate kinase